MEEPDLHRRVAGIVEARLLLAVAGAGRPREVVDVFLQEPVCLGAFGIVGLLLEPPRRPHHEAAAGQREPDVVHAVVGEELRPRMELVGVPPSLPPHADLREPLNDEEIVVDPARPAHISIRDA